MNDSPLLEVRDLAVHFPCPRPSLFGERPYLRAVDGLSFEVGVGETLGIVGESGCGKSTLARGILGLLPVSSGEVLLEGESITGLSKTAKHRLRQKAQIIFQDPLASLNPRMTVGQIVAEPLWTFRPDLGRDATRREVVKTLERVGLSERHLNGYPHEFSGGQCQRIGIARALILGPKLLICDEPVSALDVSIQAQIVNLLQDLQAEMSLTLLFIAHDLSVVRHISQRIMVMYLGRVVELADRDALFSQPAHPYTQALIQSIPLPDPEMARVRPPALEGDLPSPINPPSGCRFRTRCTYARSQCAETAPPLRELIPGHRVACHFAEEIGESVPTLAS
ncbi:MAG: oligopeptide/dipeptide ABC transporter ATP-binding protein [Pseudomonadota bacterium]|nr:oligopeptide/dipeptide ABC transporter ATP-binding protein [Pseudomonadota bacterium]